MKDACQVHGPTWPQQMLTRWLFFVILITVAYNYGN